LVLLPNFSFKCFRFSFKYFRFAYCASMDNATVTSLTWHTPAEGSQGRQVGIVLLSFFGQFRPELLMLYVPVVLQGILDTFLARAY